MRPALSHDWQRALSVACGGFPVAPVPRLFADPLPPAPTDALPPRHNVFCDRAHRPAVYGRDHVSHQLHEGEGEHSFADRPSALRWARQFPCSPGCAGVHIVAGICGWQPVSHYGYRRWGHRWRVEIVEDRELIRNARDDQDDH